MNTLSRISSVVLTVCLAIAPAAWSTTTNTQSPVLAVGTKPSKQITTLEKPDFAYPKDVIATAEAFLASATPGDTTAHGKRVLALSEIVSANDMIDRKSIFDSVKLGLDMAEEARKAGEPDLAAMLYVYTAKIALDARREVPWRRETKAVRPDDISEWSGEDFNLFADSISGVAYDLATPGCPLERFAAALKIDRIGYKLTPTVRDFIVLRAYTVYRYQSGQFIERAIAGLPDNTALAYYIKAKNAQPKELKKMCQSLNGAPGSEFAVYHYISTVFSHRPDPEIYNTLLKLSKVYANSWISPSIEAALYNQKRTMVWLKTERDIAPDKPHSCTITASNIDTVHITAYGWKDANRIPNVRRTNQFITANTVRRYSFPINAGVESKVDTDSITLPAGSYIFVYNDVEKTAKDTDISEVYVVNPWRVFTYSTAKTNAVVVLDAFTGEPASGVRVEVRYYKKSKRLTVARTTDSEGIAYFNKGIEGAVSLRDQSRGLYFEDCSRLKDHRDYYPHHDNVRATIATDRNTYRPGDTVRWTAALSTDTATVANAEAIMKVSFPTPQESSSANENTTFTAGPTDAFGRIEGSFVIPKDVATGLASIRVDNADYSYMNFNISEFKLRDLSIADVLIRLSADSVFITGRTVNSAGVGASDIDVKLSSDYNDSTFTMDTRSGANGKFGFTLDRKEFQKKSDIIEDTDEYYEYYGPYSKSYSNGNDASFTLDASAPDGRSSHKGFIINVENDCGVVVHTPKVHDTTNGLSFIVTGTDYSKDENQDVFNVTWSLHKDSDKTPDNDLKGNAVSGNINIAPELLKDLTAGQYTLGVHATDCKSNLVKLALILYNPTRPELPDDGIVWIPNTTANIKRGATKAPVLVGIANDNTRLMWLTRDKNSKKAVLKSETLNRGYHTVEFDVPQFTDENLLSGVIDVWAVKLGSMVSPEIEIKYAPADDEKLVLECESFRDNTIPGGTEHWTLVTRRGAKPVSAAVAVNIYNTQLDQFGSTPSLRLSRWTYDLSWKSVYDNSPWSFCFDYYQTNKPYSSLLTLPAWLYTPHNSIVVGYGTAKRSANNSGVTMVSAAEAAYDEAAPVEMAMVSSPASGGHIYGAQAPKAETMEEIQASLDALDALDDMSIRTNTALNALWAPILTTDTTGRVDISVSIPNQTSKWRMKATAWTKDLRSASIKKTFVATKPILVAPNLPRFVRVGDTVNLVSAITNDTDTAQTVTYSMEAAGHNATGTVVIEPRHTSYVTTIVPVTGQTALADSLVVTMRASNGSYGDGERRALPILTSSALVTESRNFYLNAADTVYRTDLPRPKGTDFETELHFTNNPMWTVVESLPSIIEPTFDVTPSLVMSLYASLSAIDIATEHPVARSVIDLDKAQRTRDEVIKKLNELRAEGGFRWGKWSTAPDVYTTLNVLNWLDEDLDKPDIKRLTDEALRYVDRNIGIETPKISPNMTYTLVRSAYGRPTTVKGQQIFDATIKHVLGNWKKFSLNEKSIAALILYRTGNRATAQTIMNSVIQFGTVTPDRGLIFHNMPSITAYATMLTAMSSIMPDSPYLDSVRQALLYLRQGMKWSTSAYTAYAVRAISTGSTWVVNRAADDVRVSVDGNAVAIDSVAARNGAIDIGIKGSDATIERTAGTPAYGSVVTRYVAPLSDIRSFSDGEISVEKHIYAVDNESRRVDIKDVDLHPGQRLVVSFTIKAARPLTGVILNDMRPAAFEPVDQLSRYSYAGELGYFLENRDSATNIYLYFVPRGTYIIEYPVTINNTGTFTTGVATVTSTVDPDITAHSASTPLLITE